MMYFTVYSVHLGVYIRKYSKVSIISFSNIIKVQLPQNDIYLRKWELENAYALRDVYKSRDQQ